AGTLQLSSSYQFVNEGLGVATYTVTRTNGSAGAVGVQFYTSDITAISGLDYAGVDYGTPHPVNFADGPTSASFTVAIFDNNLVQATRYFSVHLVNPAGGAVLGSLTANSTFINDPLLMVDDVTPTLSGVVVDFNRAFNTAPINLYNALGSGL